MASESELVRLRNDRLAAKHHERAARAEVDELRKKVRKLQSRERKLIADLDAVREVLVRERSALAALRSLSEIGTLTFSLHEDNAKETPNA